MSNLRSLSPFNEKVEVIQFSCLRVEFVAKHSIDQIKIIVCEKYIFSSQAISQRQAIVNQTQLIEVVNDKIKIELPNIGTSTIDLNTYQAFSLEKVPIYDRKQLIGFLCFKILQINRKISQYSIQFHQSRDLGSNLFTKAFNEQQKQQQSYNSQQLQQQQRQKILKQEQSNQKISYEEIKKNVDYISRIYEDMNREQNYQLQQELKLRKLEEEVNGLNETFNQLNIQEQEIDAQFQNYKHESPQFQILQNERLRQKHLILNYKKQQKSLMKVDIPVNLSIPFSFNEYFSLYKN